MRLTTVIALGIRHVGKASEPDEIHEGMVRDMAKLILQKMVESSLASRLEFIVARRESDVRLAWYSGKRGAEINEDEFDSMLAELEKIENGE